MRILAATLAILAAATAFAAKPPADLDPEAMAARAQSIAACLSSQMGDVDPGADSPFADCECAIARLEGDGRSPGGRDAKEPLNEAYDQCRSERIEGRTVAAIPPEPTGPPVDKPAAAGPAADRPAFAFFDRLSGLALPDWGWIAIPGVALVIGLFVLFGRRRRSDDLLGPPSSMTPPDERSS